MKAAAAPKPPVLRGKSVVVTGTFARPRKEMEKLIAAGCAVGGSVSPKTELLLVGTDAGSKLAKAQKLGVAIMTEPEFEAFGASSPADTTRPQRQSPPNGRFYADQLAGLSPPIP